MSLAPGDRLGPYQILGPLGAGGMGEVYRARDTRLGREVAIKVLPVSVSSDVERLRRFEKEARSASSLNHPNIVIIHDVGTEGETSFIAMELVEGRTLRDLLADGPLQAKKLLSTAAQVADGLAKAHQAGIVHRDLKPENIMVTRGGVAKILDFGLSKLAQAEVSEERQSHAPTQSLATEPGVVVGTVGYMSPEQTLGEPLDVRSDQFSFGSVLYEMATGKPPFRKRTRPETMTAILREEPEPLATAAPSVPVPLHWIVERCLAKEREERYASTEDLARDLARLREHASGSASSGGGSSAERVSGGIRLRPSLFAGALLGALVLGIGLGVLRPPPPSSTRRRFEASLNPPAGRSFDLNLGFSLSPDGSKLAFCTDDMHLWVRDLSTPNARELPAAAGALDPFWSPDGRSIAFFSERKLKVIDLSSMSIRVICDAPGGRGGSWNGNGTILFAPESKAGLFRVLDAGGQPQPATSLDSSRRDESHRYPTFLPDGRHFLFVGWHLGAGPDNLPWILLGSLDSREVKPIARAFSAAIYSPAGFLLYAAKDRTLVAQPFDLRRLSTAGQPFPIVGQIIFGGARANCPVAAAVADPRILIYQSGTAASLRLAWFDGAGKQLDIVGPAADYGDVRLSPDGRRAAVEVTNPRNGEFEIWIFDLSRGTGSPWNPDSGYNQTPVWSPDGSQIVFASYRKGDANLYVGRADGSAPITPLLESPDNKQPMDWSPDGRWIMYTSFDKETGSDLWLLPMFGDHRPKAFLRTQFFEGVARISPDGRWVAYVSNPSGQYEVYVTPFAEPGERVQVSTHGGSNPRWSKDGREILFVAEGKLMSASFHAGPPLVVDAPRIRFEVTGEPSPDLQRFLMVIPDKDFIPPPLTVALDWFAGRAQ